MKLKLRNTSKGLPASRERRRPKRRLVAAILATLAAATVQAETTDTDFQERVRSYILDNPEVILQALEILAERETRAAVASKIAVYPDLFAETPVLGMGPQDAPLKVIEFFDYRCVPCKALHPKLKAALEEHPNIRVEMRHLPILTPGSERGARFALAVKKVAGASVYEAVHDDVWALQGPLRQMALERIALNHGLDWEVVKNEMNDDAVTARIARNRDIAIDLEILGTPAFVTPTSVSFGQSDAVLLVESWLSQ